MRLSTIVAPAAVGLVVGLTAVFGSFAVISPGEKGVIVTAGKVVGEAEPGILLKVPFVTNVPTFSTRDQVVNFDDLQAYTKDQQTATVTRVSVTYRINPAYVVEIYTRYGSTENLVNQFITRRVGAALEASFGQFNAELAVRDRVGLGQDFANRLKDGLDDTPLIVSAVNIENFSFPDEYEANINARMPAEVEALKAEQTAKKTVIDAQATAEARLTAARAEAESIRLRGEAEAAAIKARADALAVTERPRRNLG